MPQAGIKIYDTTLRDGLRNSGVSMTLEQKLDFAHKLNQLQVDAVEIGYGGPSQVEPMQHLCKELSHSIVFGLSRVNLKDVKRVLRGVEHARQPGVNIFSPTSDFFLEKMQMTRQQAIDTTCTAITYAKQHVDHIVFSAQDATRTDQAYLASICAEAIGAGASTISIADSVSYALPHQFGPFCESVRTKAQGGKNVIWSVHCHNDLGLGVANSLAAIEHGFHQVECTLNGIGERAGNTPLQHVASALRLREDAFPNTTPALAWDQLASMSQSLSELSGQEFYFNSAQL